MELTNGFGPSHYVRRIQSVVLLIFGFCLVGSHLAAAADDGGSTLWDKVLKRHVEDGLVNYKALAKDKDFRTYLGWLKSANPDSLSAKEARLAFWVNAYNALAIAGVLENFPIGKVTNVPGFFNKKKHAVAGGEYTLDEIEKQIIFKKFDNPKIHFVLVCAAMSCPKLPSEAYTEANIFQKMDEVTKAFLNNPEKNRLDKKKKIFFVSKIFSWYEKDFVSGPNKTVLDFIKPYLSRDKQKFLSENRVEVKFLEYDWSLNML